MSCGVGCRRALDLTLLWLWHRRVATALIGPLAWNLPLLLKKAFEGVPVVVQWLTNPTRNHEVVGSIPALAQWVNNPVLP